MIQWPQDEPFKEVVPRRSYTSPGNALFSISKATQDRFLHVAIDVADIPTPDTLLGLRLEHTTGDGRIKHTTQLGRHTRAGIYMWIIRPKAMLFQLRWTLAGPKAEARFGVLVEEVDKIPEATIFWAQPLAIDLTDESKIGDAVCIPVLPDDLSNTWGS